MLEVFICCFCAVFETNYLLNRHKSCFLLLYESKEKNGNQGRITVIFTFLISYISVFY